MKEFNSKKNFFTTRPQPASFLLKHGCSGELTVNPYDTSRPAWCFERNKILDTWVDVYFNRRESK